MSTLPPGAYSLGGITPISDFVNAISETRAPTAVDTDYEIGQVWVNRSGNTAYILTSFSTSSGIKLANWVLICSSTTQFIVGPSGLAPYQSIQAAINDAVMSGASINNVLNVFIMAGSYQEDFTIYQGINLIGYGGDSGNLAFLSGFSHQIGTVILNGNVSIDTTNSAESAFVSFVNIYFNPSDGNVIVFLSNPANYDAVYFLDCALIVNGTGNFVFSVDGYPTVYLSGCSIIDNGTSNNLLQFPGTYQFFTLSANKTIFNINYSSPLVLATNSYILFNLSFCNYGSMIDASGTNISFGLEADSSVFFYDSSPGTPLIKFGNQTGRLILNGCYFNTQTGPIVSSTSNNSYVRIYNTFISNSNSSSVGTVDVSNSIITNSSRASTTFPDYLEIFKGIGSGYKGSQEIRAQSSIQTTNNTQTTLSSILLNELESIVLKGNMCAAQSNHTNAVGGDFLIVARRASGGNITLIGSAITNVESSSAATFTCDVDIVSQSVRIRVTGIAATTYNWVATYSYFKTLDNS